MIVTPDQPASTHNAPEQVIPLVAASTPLRVVILDDSAEQRAAAGHTLEGQLSVAGEAALGTEAVALVRESQPDAVLLSMEEPVARALRTLEALNLVVPTIPVIVLSSLPEGQHLRQAMMAGARNYLVRPVDVTELVRTVAALHDRERKRSALNEGLMDTGHTGEIVSFFSGKGGIGKTTLATNLAVALALHAKQRVALIDLDLHFGDVAVSLDVFPERTIADLVDVVDKLDPELLRGFVAVHSSGLKVLPAPTEAEDGERVQAEHVQKMLNAFARTYDYVVIDTPRELNDVVIAALDASTKVYLVAANQVQSLKSTRLALGMFKRWRYTDEKVKLVLNQPYSNALQVGDAEEALDYPIFWKVPHDAQAAASGQWGKAFVQDHAKSKIAQNIISLAQVSTGTRVGGRSLLRRLRG
ncbi:MAG: AAA family ATPase [Chloroflexi bacterium]|nr:AAA family ATPase [Chloroflexota bacterium]